MGKIEALAEACRPDVDAWFGGAEAWAFKDPRLCLTLPVWLPALAGRRAAGVSLQAGRDAAVGRPGPLRGIRPSGRAARGGVPVAVPGRRVRGDAGLPGSRGPSARGVPRAVAK